MGNRKYDIKHRRVAKRTMFFEEHLSWIERNKPDGMSEAAFISDLLGMGIQVYQKSAVFQENAKEITA